MARYTSQQYVELFHLLFLDQLGRKLDKRYYVLKGGCNLRFYLKSIRYSEDIDFDVMAVSKNDLQVIVEAILGSRPFVEILRVHGLEIVRRSAPKQTETTQRWKLLLGVAGSDIPLPTKIEFSRRGVCAGSVFENIDPDVIGAYRLSPIMANHYDSDAAFKQKLGALATRATTQARDIFDLNLLLTSGGVDTTIGDEGLTNLLDQAKANAMGIKFSDFKSKVLSYLPPDMQAQYDSESVWDDIVLRVTEVLEKHRT